MLLKILNNNASSKYNLQRWHTRCTHWLTSKESLITNSLSSVSHQSIYYTIYMHYRTKALSRYKVDFSWWSNSSGDHHSQRQGKGDTQRSPQENLNIP